MGVVALLCLVLLMVPGAAPETPFKSNTACYGIEGGGPCSRHEPRCDTGRVFIVQALRGVKPGSSACPERTPICPPDPGSCCQPEEGDCMETYSAYHFQQLYIRCWNKTSCSYTVPQHYSQSCGAGFHKSSGYSEIHYVCLTGSSITDFYWKTPVRGSGMAVAYSYSYTNQEGRLSCRVDSASCSRVSTNVLLYRGASVTCKGGPRFTTLHLNSDQCFNCSESSNFAAVQNVSTPFTISLEIVRQITVSRAWVVVQGSDTDVLSLTCGYPNDTVDTALCPGTSTPSTTSSTTPSTSNSTTSSISSNTSTNTSISTSTTPRTSTTTSTTPSTTPNTSTSISTSTTSSTASSISGSCTLPSGIIGGTAAAALVVLAVTVLALVLFFRHRHKVRSRQAETDNSPYSGLSEMSRRHRSADDSYLTLGQAVAVDRSAAPPPAGADDSAYADPTYLTPDMAPHYVNVTDMSNVNRGADTPLPGADNSAYTSLSELTRHPPSSNSDYAILGQNSAATKTTQSRSTQSAGRSQ